MRAIIVSCGICFFAIAVALNGKYALADTDTTVRLVGTYSNLEINEDSGDLLGLEITISAVGRNYYAVFQSSEGEARPPIVVPISITKNQIQIVVHEKSGYNGTLIGEIKNDGIYAHFKEGQLDPQGEKEFVLKRQCSFWSR